MKMGVKIGEKIMKAEYTKELSEELKTICGLDAEKELEYILRTEIIGEIARDYVKERYITKECLVEMDDKIIYSIFSDFLQYYSDNVQKIEYETFRKDEND